MDAFAQQMRANGMNARAYHAWTKLWKNHMPSESPEHIAALSRNADFIRRAMKQGKVIVDLGPDGRAVPSEFYMLEKLLLAVHDYSSVISLY